MSKGAPMNPQSRRWFFLLSLSAVFGFSGAARAADTVWLSSLDLRCVQQGWGQPRADCALDGQAISINGRLFTNGLATHAHSTFYVAVNGNAERFTAMVGVEDALGNNLYGTVQFAVIGDARLLWQSGIVRARTSALPVDVDLRGVQTVAVLAGSADDGIDWDHAVWADACFSMRAGTRPQAVAPLPATSELGILTRAQYTRLASVLTTNQAAPVGRLAHNGVRAETSEWTYDGDAAAGQRFRCAVTLPHADPRSAAPFPDDAAFIVVSNEVRQAWLDTTWNYARDLVGLAASPDWREEVKREIVFLRIPEGQFRKLPGRRLVRLYKEAASEHYVQMLYADTGLPLAFESRVATPVTERIAMRLLDALAAGTAFDVADPLSARLGTFYDPGEWRFEQTAYSYEGRSFLDPMGRSNPFRPDLDPPDIDTLPEYLNSEEYRSWCWYWWHLYGRVNGMRGNWNASRGQWCNSQVVVARHHNLDFYNSADGRNTGDTQELEPAFYQDLEDCHVALFSGHGGPVNGWPQMSGGSHGWFAWGLGPYRLGDGNLRHLMIEGCGILSYWRDRPGRVLAQRWLAADFIDGLRTVSGFDGEYIGSDRNGWRFFGRYHQGQSLGDAWAFAAMDECPDNAPVTVAYGATEQEALSTLWDGRFSTNRASPLWAAAGLWVSIRPRWEVLPERTNCVYLSDLEPVSHHQDWGQLGADMSVGGHVLTIGREMFDRGLGVHANSETIYALPTNQFLLFEVLVGLDAAGTDSQGRPPEGGTIQFEVYLDGVCVQRSGIVSSSRFPTLLHVPLGQARSLGLVVRDAGDGITCDAADWAMARLVPNAPLAFVNPRVPGPTQFEFTLTGPAAAMCFLEASSNLVSWSRVAAYVPFPGTVTCLRPLPEAQRQFYRAQLVP